MTRPTFIAACIWGVILGAAFIYAGWWDGYETGIREAINSCRTLRGEEPLP